MRDASTFEPQAGVKIITKPLWKLRLGRELPRYAFVALSIAGVASSVRFVVDPPRSTASKEPYLRPPHQDLAAEGYAQLFARAYLTWQAGDPEARQQGLAQFVGPGLEPDAGLQPPTLGEQQVQWTDVVQEREATPDEHVYTVAAQTNTTGLLYLAVSIVRAASGALELASYPAFIGAPLTAPAHVGQPPAEVREPALHMVVERALRNYLGSSPSELAADLTGNAEISLPPQALTLEDMQRLNWSSEGSDAVSAIVQARDARGTRYTLVYDVDVARIATRWEISAIEMNPAT